MTFSTGFLADPQGTNSGELVGQNHIVLSAETFEDGLKVGRFAKLDTGSIDNFDGSATPVVAGVVKRYIYNSTEDANLLDQDNHTFIEYIREGLVTVQVKSGDTPALLDRVFISNDGDANDGLATTSNAQVDANAEFIAEVSSDTWLIYLTAAPGDVATHIADATAAHAASAISIADAGGFTSEIEVEAALQEIYPFIPLEVADPGDAAAIPVTKSAVIAITTGAGGETNTLADPGLLGIELTISHDVDGGGARVITAATAINEAGNTIITLDDPGETVVLKSVQVAGGNVWRVVVADGATLS